MLTVPRNTWLVMTAISFLSLAMSFLLSFAYPYGIAYFDTYSYLELAKDFRVLTPNLLDWWRTIPYGALLALSLNFSEPTVFVYWFQSLVFALAIAASYPLALALFDSRKTALAISLIFLAVEVISMRAFFLNVELLTDPLFASSVLLGIELLLLGWLRERVSLSLTGSLLLGVAALMRPVGIALFPVWIIFLFVTHRRRENSILQSFTWKAIMPCVLLLLGPVLLWSARNAFVYGQFTPTVFSSHELLSRVLPLVEDDDVLFDDIAINKAFLFSLRRFEEEVGGKKQIYYAWHRSETNIGPFQFLELIVIEEGFGTPDSNEDNARLRFKTEKHAGALAKRIIFAHPVGYASMFFRDYFLLSSRIPLETDETSSRLRATFREAYLPLTDPQIAEHLSVFYPPAGELDASRHSPRIASILHAVCCNDLFDAMRTGWHKVAGAIEHVLFFVIAFFLVYKEQRKHGSHVRVLASLAMLFLTASALFALTSVAERPLARYALSGEMPLSLFRILLIAFLILLFRKRRLVSASS